MRDRNIILLNLISQLNDISNIISNIVNIVNIIEGIILFFSLTNAIIKRKITNNNMKTSKYIVSIKKSHLAKSKNIFQIYQMLYIKRAIKVYLCSE